MAALDSYKTNYYEVRIAAAKFASWVFTGVASFFLAVTLLFVLTLFQMGRQLTVYTQLFTVLKSSDELVIADTFDERIAAKDLMTEALVRRFVVLRNENVPDAAENMIRFRYGGEFSRLASRKIYSDIVSRDIKSFGNKRAQLPAEVVNIKKVEKIRGGNWRVEYAKTTYISGSLPMTKDYIASIGVVYNPSYVSFSPVLTNPLGVMIVEYSSAPKTGG